MSTQSIQKRKTIRDISAYKNAKEAFVCLTAYTAPLARLADAHADLILVGDSLGMVIYGFESTLPVTLDMMIAHGRTVAGASSQALITVDMPFGSYQEGREQAFRNAARIMAETACQAVKIEGGAEMAETIAFLAQRGIPVMGHIGLQPQSVNSIGGYRVVGRIDDEQRKILADAKALADSGAFSIVLECMDADLAAEVTAAVPVPTIGIGASVACDGQILVCDDMLGLTGGKTGGKLPRFVKPYTDLADIVDNAFSRYAAEVRARRFPALEHTYLGTPKKTLKIVD